MSALALRRDDVVRQAQRMDSDGVVRFAKWVVPLNEREPIRIGHATDPTSYFSDATDPLSQPCIVPDRFELESRHQDA